MFFSIYTTTGVPHVPTYSTGYKKYNMQGLKYLTDQPLKTVVKQYSCSSGNFSLFVCIRCCVLYVLWLFTRQGLRDYDCVSIVIVLRTPLARDGSGQL